MKTTRAAYIDQLIKRGAELPAAGKIANPQKQLAVIAAIGCGIAVDSAVNQ